MSGVQVDQGRQFLALLRENPYPTYRMLREADPVFWNEALQTFIVTRHADVSAVLRDHAQWSANRRESENFKQLKGIPDDFDFPVSLLGLDPPDHTRLRNLVMKAFTPRMVERLRPRVEEIVSGLLDEAEAKGGFDLIADFAYPLPVTVIAEMLGVPPADWEKFRGWSSTLAASIDPMITREQLDAALVARNALWNYFRGIIALRRKEPREDLISGLIAAEEEGHSLSEVELLVMLNLLLVAGHETTVNLQGNGVLALLRNPDQFDRLRRHPELIETAIEEMLRYDSPVQLTSRVAAADTGLGDKSLRQGQTVMLLLGAANHDPEVYADPEKMDISRTPNPHLSFSRGIHFCLGAPLARLEGQVAIGAMVERFPNLRLANSDEPVQWREQLILRGLETLPLSV